MAPRVIISPPTSTGPMDLYNAEEYFEDEKHTHSHLRNHKSCHNSRLRRYFVPILALFLLISALLLVSYLPGIISAMGWGGSSKEATFGAQVIGLLARATTQTTGSSSTSPSSSTDAEHKKLILIVVIVGFFVLLVAAVLLSACCCKSAFKNPLCCPCYLCACCGGLACLECIGCGLCCVAGEELL